MQCKQNKKVEIERPYEALSKILLDLNWIWIWLDFNTHAWIQMLNTNVCSCHVENCFFILWMFLFFSFFFFGSSFSFSSNNLRNSPIFLLVDDLKCFCDCAFSFYFISYVCTFDGENNIWLTVATIHFSKRVVRNW